MGSLPCLRPRLPSVHVCTGQAEASAQLRGSRRRRREAIRAPHRSGRLRSPPVGAILERPPGLPSRARLPPPPAVLPRLGAIMEGDNSRPYVLRRLHKTDRKWLIIGILCYFIVHVTSTGSAGHRRSTTNRRQTRRYQEVSKWRSGITNRTSGLGP